MSKNCCNQNVGKKKMHASFMAHATRACKLHKKMLSILFGKSPDYAAAPLSYRQYTNVNYDVSNLSFHQNQKEDETNCTLIKFRVLILYICHFLSNGCFQFTSFNDNTAVVLKTIFLVFGISIPWS